MAIFTFVYGGAEYINFMVSQLIRVGNLPVSLGVGARYYAEDPRTGPDWGLRFAQ